MDPGHRGRRQARPVVPPHLRHEAARLQLGAPRGARRVRVDPALLARPRRRRLPRRRRPRPHQGAGPARLGARRCSDSEHRSGRGRARRCGTRTASTRSTAPGARSSSPTARPTASLRGGVGRAAGARRRLRPSRRDAPGVQLRLPHRLLDGRGPARRHHRVAARRGLRRRRRRRGCCPTTTSCATPRVSASHRARPA